MSIYTYIVLTIIRTGWAVASILLSFFFEERSMNASGRA